MLPHKLLVILTSISLVSSCGPGTGMNRNIARPKHLRPLKVYEIVPEVSECNLAASGPCFGPVVNGSDRFDKLVSLYDPRIKFGASGFHDNRVKLMSKVRDSKVKFGEILVKVDDLMLIEISLLLSIVF